MADAPHHDRLDAVDTQAGAPSRVWRRELWLPIVLLATHAMGGAWASAWIDTLERRGYLHVSFALGGFLLSQPLLCAAWAAWAPHRAVFRVPLGAAACFCLALALATAEPNLMIIFMEGGLFSLFFVGLALVRRRWLWRLACGDELSDPATGESRFSVRYLLVWTTVVAVLASLGRFVLGDAAIGVPSDSAEEIARAVTGIVAMFASVMTPAMIAAACVLGKRARWLSAALVLLAGGACVSYACVAVMTWFVPVGQSFNEMWGTLFCMALGAGVSVTLSAAALRVAGYRLVRRA